MASDDLLYGDTVLSSREAMDLSKFKNIDLSTLEPKPNAVWSPEPKQVDDQSAIEVESGDRLTFEGSISSNEGLYRFNATPMNGSGIYTVHMDLTLHTMLLRKNILRKLGYTIPAMKYLKKVLIHFNSANERDLFMGRSPTKEQPVGVDSRVTNATGRAASRWATKVDDLTIELKDVAVSEPSENDFYNVSMGMPKDIFNNRTLRALIIPYSILNLYESINKFSWIAGKIDNRSVVLSHFIGIEFGSAIEDAQWMIRKFNQLSREDIKTAVDQAFFPPEIGAIVTEKVISRRNSINRLFSDPTPELPFSSKDSKAIRKNYEGYAALFAFEDAESPLAELNYYLYSKIQSTVIDNLIAKFNSKLKINDLNNERADFFHQQFEDGLSHYLETGEIQPIKVDTWVAPQINAQLIFSRDIILGNYLGTDNLVQLADTIGASLDIGLHLGIEGLGNNLSASVRATTAIVRTFTHIKPVKSLKQSLKQPYKNMFVNLLKKTLREKYFSLYELKHSPDVEKDKAKKIQNLLKEISEHLDTGESLIMTDRFMPSADLRLNFSNGMVGAGIGAGANVTTIKRIHIYKKSPQILQIYDDSGFVTDLDVSFQMNMYIPLLKVTGKYSPGNYKIKSYMVNLESDLEKNPDFFTNASGVYHVLKDKDFEILDTTIQPVKMDANFNDTTHGLSLLFWKIKKIKGKTYYDFKARDGINGKYFSFTDDFMSGINIDAFAKQVANYYLADWSKGSVAIDADTNANPGDTFLGRSSTQTTRFEAAINEDQKFEKKFISLSDVKQGWALSSKSLKKTMVKINEKFQAPLFDITQIDFDKLRLFKIGYHINLYERGIERINNIKLSEIEALETRYNTENKCIPDNPDTTSLMCRDLVPIKRDLKKCKKSSSEEDLAICNAELFKHMFALLKFNDFKQLVGIDNIYVYGTMDGFREHSEILNNTIFSNTVGRIGSKQWSGPLDVVRELLGLSSGEFTGNWLRESI